MDSQNERIHVYMIPWYYSRNQNTEIQIKNIKFNNVLSRDTIRELSFPYLTYT
jgi:hypothetical protein